MTSLKPPMMRRVVTLILQVRTLGFRVVKSLPQGHTAWESGGQGASLNFPHPSPPAPQPAPPGGGSPSSVEFPAESPTPHHSVPGMVQPLFSRGCPAPEGPRCPAARLSLTPAGTPGDGDGGQAPRCLWRAARALCSSGPGLWTKKSREISPAQRALKAAVSSGSSCRRQARSLPRPSQRAWTRASPRASLPRKLRDPEGLPGLDLARWQEVLFQRRAEEPSRAAPSKLSTPNSLPRSLIPPRPRPARQSPRGGMPLPGGPRRPTRQQAAQELNGNGARCRPGAAGANEWRFARGRKEVGVWGDLKLVTESTRWTGR